MPDSVLRSIYGNNPYNFHINLKKWVINLFSYRETEIQTEINNFSKLKYP